MKYWVGDGLVDADGASVSILDHGLTVGDGVFETLKVARGVPFAMSRHLRRLAASARALGLPVPDLDSIRSAAADVLEANRAALPEVARLRITLTGGPGPFGTDRGNAAPTLLVTLSPATAWPATAAVCVVPWTRNERAATAGVKATSYAENIVALAYAKERAAAEAIFGNTRGELCEGTGSNVFVVLGDRVVTPPLASGCLAGITRELIIEWFDVSEEPLALEVLNTADEVFIASSTRDVMGVHRVDDRTLAAPGSRTSDFAAAFAANAAANPDP